jgi:hypothetical protein
MEHEGQSLDDLLNDVPVEAVEAIEAEPAPQVAEAPDEAPSGPERGPDGKFVSKQTTGVEDTVPPTDKLPTEEYKAIREEREKRQALQAELEALKAQFNSQQQPQEPPAPPPTIWEDEQGWQQHFGAQVAQQAALNAKLDLSEMLNRRDNADFDDMKARFLEMAQQNPAIVQDALSDADPWGKAYKIAKNAATMAELGATNVEELKAKIREELMAEMQQAQVPVPQLTIPPSLTGERNVGDRTGPAWAGPKPLSELLG